MPLLVAWLWRLGYDTSTLRERAADAVTWRWTPRRLGVALGVIEPGERGVIAVDRERRIRALTAHAHAVHHGGGPMQSFHGARLRRLALLADDEMIREVQRRISRVHSIEIATAPVAARMPSVARAPRATASAPGAALASTPAHARPGAHGDTPAPANVSTRAPSPAAAVARQVVTRPYTQLLAETSALLERDGAVSLRTVQRDLNVGATRARRLLADARRATAIDGG
jgi:hypothetical protein